MRHCLLTLATFSLLAAPVSAADCSCRAPDRSCSASTSCPGGCYAICGSGGNCTAGCSGGSGPTPDQQTPLVLSDPSAADLVTLSATDLTADDIAALLTTALETDVRFAPVDPLQTYSMHVIDFPPEDLANALANYGAVAVSDHPADDDPLWTDSMPQAEVTIRIDGATIGMVASVLGQLLAGSGLSIEVPDPSSPFNLDVQRMPLKELLTSLERMGVLQLAGR